MRPVLCPGENFDPKLSQQPDGVDTRGVVQRFGADGCVGSVSVDVRPDQGDFDLQWLIEAGSERCVAQTQGCRVEQGHRSYQDRNEYYKPSTFHFDQQRWRYLPTDVSG
jgi:hypothetical protein